MSDNRPRLSAVFSVLLVAVIVPSAIALAWGYRLGHRTTLREDGVILSPEQCKMISADLDSSDPIRLGVWKLYFRRAAEGRITLGQPNLFHSEISRMCYDEYKAREMPRQSNYFGVLMAQLAQQSDAETLTAEALTNYLGTPDSSSSTPGRVVLRYDFSVSSHRYVGTAEATNGLVSDISMYREDDAK